MTKTLLHSLLLSDLYPDISLDVINCLSYSAIQLQDFYSMSHLPPCQKGFVFSFFVCFTLFLCNRQPNTLAFLQGFPILGNCTICKSFSLGILRTRQPRLQTVLLNGHERPTSQLLVVLIRQWIIRLLQRVSLLCHKQFLHHCLKISLDIDNTNNWKSNAQFYREAPRQMILLAKVCQQSCFIQISGFGCLEKLIVSKSLKVTRMDGQSSLRYFILFYSLSAGKHK